MSDLRYSPLNRKVVALLFSLLLLVASIIILIPEYIRSELELLLLLLLPGGPVWVDLVVQSQRNFVVLFYRSQWLEGRFQWIRAKRGRHRRQMTMRGGALCNDGVFVWTGFDPNRGHGSFLRNENNVTRTNYREHTLVIVILATMLSTN